MSLISRRSLIAGASSLLTLPALAEGPFNGGSKIDPWLLPNIANFGLTNVFELFTDTAGRTPKSRAIVGGQKTVVLLCYGQSLIANNDEDVYVAASNLNQQFCVTSSGIYVAANPCLGAAWLQGATARATYVTRLGDKLIADGYCDRVIVANVAIGSTLIANWAAGGMCNVFISVVTQRLLAAGLIPANLFKFFVLQHQGESQDPVTALQYKTSGLSALATVPANGITPTASFIAVASYNGGTISAAVDQGQMDMVNGTTIFQGPDINSFGSGYRYDNLHLNSAGCVAVSNAWATILEMH